MRVICASGILTHCHEHHITVEDVYQVIASPTQYHQWCTAKELLYSKAVIELLDPESTTEPLQDDDVYRILLGPVAFGTALVVESGKNGVGDWIFEVECTRLFGLGKNAFRYVLHQEEEQVENNVASPILIKVEETIYSGRFVFDSDAKIEKQHRLLIQLLDEYLVKCKQQQEQQQQEAETNVNDTDPAGSKEQATELTMDSTDAISTDERMTDSISTGNVNSEVVVEEVTGMTPLATSDPVVKVPIQSSTNAESSLPDNDDEEKEKTACGTAALHLPRNNNNTPEHENVLSNNNIDNYSESTPAGGRTEESNKLPPPPCHKEEDYENVDSKQAASDCDETPVNDDEEDDHYQNPLEEPFDTVLYQPPLVGPDENTLASLSLAAAATTTAAATFEDDDSPQQHDTTAPNNDGEETYPIDNHSSSVLHGDSPLDENPLETETDMMILSEKRLSSHADDDDDEEEEEETQVDPNHWDPHRNGPSFAIIPPPVVVETTDMDGSWPSHQHHRDDDDEKEISCHDDHFGVDYSDECAVFSPVMDDDDHHDDTSDTLSPHCQNNNMDPANNNNNNNTEKEDLEAAFVNTNIPAHAVVADEMIIHNSSHSSRSVNQAAEEDGLHGPLSAEDPYFSTCVAMPEMMVDTLPASHPDHAVLVAAADADTHDSEQIRDDNSSPENQPENMPETTTQAVDPTTTTPPSLVSSSSSEDETLTIPNVNENKDDKKPVSDCQNVHSLDQTMDMSQGSSHQEDDENEQEEGKKDQQNVDDNVDDPSTQIMRVICASGTLWNGHNLEEAYRVIASPTLMKHWCTASELFSKATIELIEPASEPLQEDDEYRILMGSVVVGMAQVTESGKNGVGDWIFEVECNHLLGLAQNAFRYVLHQEEENGAILVKVEEAIYSGHLVYDMDGQIEKQHRLLLRQLDEYLVKCRESATTTTDLAVTEQDTIATISESGDATAAVETMHPFSESIDLTEVVRVTIGAAAASMHQQVADSTHSEITNTVSLPEETCLIASEDIDPASYSELQENINPDLVTTAPEEDAPQNDNWKMLEKHDNHQLSTCDHNDDNGKNYDADRHCENRDQDEADCHVEEDREHGTNQEEVEVVEEVTSMVVDETQESSDTRESPETSVDPATSVVFSKDFESESIPAKEGKTFVVVASRDYDPAYAVVTEVNISNL